MDIKLERPVREPSVGDVYLYDAKHYMVIEDNVGHLWGVVNLETMRHLRWSPWIDHLTPVRDGEYVGTLRITT